MLATLRMYLYGGETSLSLGPGPEKNACLCLNYKLCVAQRWAELINKPDSDQSYNFSSLFSGHGVFLFSFVVLFNSPICMNSSADRPSMPFAKQNSVLTSE